MKESDLGRLVERIREEIEADDKIREAVLPLVRTAVRNCSSAVREVHREHYQEAEHLIKQAKEIIREARDEVVQSSFLQQTRILDVAFQELTEASTFLSLLRDGSYVSPDELDVPTRPFLTGLADTVGELRRAVLDSIRRNDLGRGENLLRFMEEILDQLNTFDFPGALVPDLRRKCDVARSLVEKTRGDLTMAIYQSRLVEKLHSVEENLREMRAK